MSQDRLVLTDELIQRYHDGELEDELKMRVEAALETDPARSADLALYRGLSRLLYGYAEDAGPDELTVRRNWEAVSRGLGRAPRSILGRKLPWLSVAAAATIAAFVFGPFQKAHSAEAIVESIDCTYPSFMLFSPDEAGAHTIIWINDNES